MYTSPFLAAFSDTEIVSASASSSQSAPWGICYSGNSRGNCRSSHDCRNHGVGSYCYSGHVYNF